jgi:hypothetical protein
MVDRAIDDKPPDTLVVVFGEGFWTGSSTLPHLHQFLAARPLHDRPGRHGLPGPGSEATQR